jgi:oligoendopeptidase F
MAAAAPQTMVREEIPTQYKWDLSHIYSAWEEWDDAFRLLDGQIEALAKLQGTLAKGPQALLHAFGLRDEVEALAHKVYWYPSLMHDTDTRDNEVDGRRQRVASLLARSNTAMAWMNPELLRIDPQTLQAWMETSPDLALYRFVLEDLQRQKDHVLDELQERLLSYSSQLRSAPRDAYSMLSTADAAFPTVTLTTGENVQITPSRYHTILNTAPAQADRAAAFEAMYGVYARTANTYAALYLGVCQKDWFIAQARNYSTTLEAALHGNDIPTSVVENLLTTTKAGVAPLRRYFGVRQRALDLRQIHLYDGTVPLVRTETRYPYDSSVEQVLASVSPLGDVYQEKMRSGFQGGWLDVYENEGKRSGAYSAPVYGVHPYMLLNYNDTLDSMFTLAHEMGHSMHTVLSHETQPFVYADYTIFVAEVASTLNEALLLDHLLERTENPAERVRLLQRAIDAIVGTFYTQVMFADYELQAHRLVERGEPVTVETLSGIYWGLLGEYYGDAVTLDEAYRLTWARIPHFFRSPYYVYQYATCFASAAKIHADLTDEDEDRRADTLDRYLTLLRSGGNDHPMNQLRKAGVDLSRPDTVQAVITQVDQLIDRLEAALAAL